MNNKYLGSTVGIIVALCTWMITNVASYSEVRNNWMFVVFFILVMGTLGGIIAQMFDKKELKSEETK